MNFNLILGLECNELHATCNERPSEKDLMHFNRMKGAGMQCTACFLPSGLGSIVDEVYAETRVCCLLCFKDIHR